MEDDGLAPHADDSMPPGAKRGPGRPRNPKTHMVIPRQGIVSKPSNLVRVPNADQVYAVELMYDNPQMFRRIFRITNSMKVSDIRIRFNPDCMEIYAIDHLAASQIYYRIAGKMMNLYYCERVVEFGVKAKEIFDTCECAGRDTDRIMFTMRRAHLCRKLKITTTYDTLGEQEERELSVEPIAEYNWDIRALVEAEQDYHIKFTLPFKYFKDKITDYGNNHCEVLKVQKTHNTMLRFHYEHKSGVCNTYFKHPEKINLKCTLPEGEIFSTGFNLSHVYELASCSTITPEIGISCHKNSPFIFTLLMDRDMVDKKLVPGTEKCVIKVVTKHQALTR